MNTQKKKHMGWGSEGLWASVLEFGGISPSWPLDVFTPHPQNYPDPIVQEFYGGCLTWADWWNHGLLVISSVSRPSHLPGSWGETVKSHPFNHSEVFLGPASILKLCRGPPDISFVYRKICLSLCMFQGFYKLLCQEPGTKTNCCNKRHSCHSGNYKGFRSFVPGQKLIYISYYIIIPQCTGGQWRRQTRTLGGIQKCLTIYNYAKIFRARVIKRRNPGVGIPLFAI